MPAPRPNFTAAPPLQQGMSFEDQARQMAENNLRPAVPMGAQVYMPDALKNYAEGQQPDVAKVAPDEVPKEAAPAPKGDVPRDAIARQIAKNQMQGPPAPGQFAYSVKFPGPSEPRYVPKQAFTTMMKGAPPQVSAIPDAMAVKFLKAWQAGKLDKYSPPLIPGDSSHKMANKADKDSTAWYYQMLGVTPGDKRAASHAIARLQEMQAKQPWMLTPQQERILASAAKSEAFHQSMEPAAVKARQADYAAQKEAAGIDIPEEISQPGQSFNRPIDPANQVIEQMFQNVGRMPTQGNKLPTQQDVNVGKSDPTQFKQQFPDFKPAQPQQPSEEDYPLGPDKPDESDD